MIPSSKHVIAVTPDDVKTAGACYPMEKLIDLWAGRPALKAQDIASLNIPRCDVIWALIHCNLLSDYALHEYVCWFAEHLFQLTREAGQEPDPRSTQAVMLKRAWLHGEVLQCSTQHAEEEALDAYTSTCGDVRDAAWAAWLTTRTTMLNSKQMAWQVFQCCSVVRRRALEPAMVKALVGIARAQQTSADE